MLTTTTRGSTVLGYQKRLFVNHAETALGSVARTFSKMGKRPLSGLTANFVRRPSFGFGAPSAAAIAVLVFFAAAAQALDKPLKVIAPDLVIETCEQGEFLDDPADPRHFKRSNVVGEKCGLFGWRMKVKTSRPSVLVQVKATKGPAHGLPFQAKPRFGYLFAGTDIVAGVPRGKYSHTIFVEKQPIKTFSYEIK